MVFCLKSRGVFSHAQHMRIDRTLSDEAQAWRQDMETMLRGNFRDIPDRCAPPSILSLDAIDDVMDSLTSFLFVTSYPDFTVQYVCTYPLSISRKIKLFFQRDWTKRGYLHAPYNMFITYRKKTHRYRVRSVGQFKTALKYWGRQYCPETRF